MWFEIFCGLVVYQLFRRFFIGNDPDTTDVDCRDSDACFTVAARLEKLYGGKAYVGLRIPDTDSGSRQSIDVVLVTKTEVMVAAVRNFSGFLEVGADGNWVCIKGGDKKKGEVYPDPVVEITSQTEILESYLEQRGATLPKGSLTGRVIIPNPNCRVTHSIDCMPEVISYMKWAELKPESGTGFSSWIKDTIRGGKQDGPFQKLHSILSTTPMWDRLELKGAKTILGEFVEFKGDPDDMQALKKIKRTKVSRIISQKSTAFGTFGRTKMHLLYAPRDFRSEGASDSEWNETTVRGNVEVLFMPLNSKKARKFKLSHMTSLSLSV